MVVDLPCGQRENESMEGEAGATRQRSMRNTNEMAGTGEGSGKSGIRRILAENPLEEDPDRGHENVLIGDEESIGNLMKFEIVPRWI